MLKLRENSLQTQKQQQQQNEGTQEQQPQQKEVLNQQLCEVEHKSSEDKGRELFQYPNHMRDIHNHNDVILPRYGMAITKICQLHRANKSLKEKLRKMRKRSGMESGLVLQNLWRGIYLVHLARTPPEQRKQRILEYKTTSIDEYYRCY